MRLALSITVSQPERRYNFGKAAKRLKTLWFLKTLYGNAFEKVLTPYFLVAQSATALLGIT